MFSGASKAWHDNHRDWEKPDGTNEIANRLHVVKPILLSSKPV